LTLPGTRWGTSVGAGTRHTPTGLQITYVEKGGFSERVGMQAGDLLLTLRGIRVRDTEQLWTILALTEAGSSAEASWARGRELMQARATF
jgi:S1-C subfamily serine protease